MPWPPQSVLDDVNDFRKVALEISKAAAKEGKLGEKKSEIMQTMDEGYARMEEHFLTNGSVLEDLTEIQKSLRGLPIVQLHLPTVVLVRREERRGEERREEDKRKIWVDMWLTINCLRIK